MPKSLQPWQPRRSPSVCSTVSWSVSCLFILFLFFLSHVRCLLKFSIRVGNGYSGPSWIMTYPTIPWVLTWKDANHNGRSFSVDEAPWCITTFTDSPGVTNYNGPCFQISTGKWTGYPDANPASVSNICVCQSGYSDTGSACELCAADSYVAEDGTCTACPAGDTSPAGSDSADDCVCPSGCVDIAGICTCSCPVGQTGSPGSCTNCVQKTYKDVIGSDACTACPVGFTSPVGSDSADDCVCPNGYVDIDGICREQVNCIACDTGQYYESTACAVCPDFSLVLSSNNGSSISDCLCLPGYTNASDTHCSPCNVNFFKESHANESCTNCPIYSETFFDARTSEEECFCTIGFTLNDTSLQCQACQKGTFKDVVAASVPQSPVVYALEHSNSQYA